jgi:hypothetical protein
MPSYQSVDVVVSDNTPLNNPVAGVLVRVFDETNTNFQTEATTDADGKAGFTLFTQKWNLRFFKFGAQVPQPQEIEVLEPSAGDPLVQTFDVTATVFEHPIANDPRLCRVSGFFRDVTGAPHPYLDLHVIGQFEPILLEGAGVLNERRQFRTDEDGFACFDLIRCANYEVTIQGHEDQLRSISVPDAPSANLPDLLFPVVEEVSFDISGPHSISVGDTLTLVPTVVSSDGVELVGTANADVRWSSSDGNVFSVAIGSTELVLTGVGAGSAELQAERANQTIIRIPSTAIVGVPVGVTVT